MNTTQERPAPMPASNSPFESNNTGFNRISGKKPRWDQNVKYYDIPADGQWHQVRFAGGLYMQAQHWIETKTGKKFPVDCLNYDPVTANFSKTGCPVEANFDMKNSKIPRIKGLAPRQGGIIHAFIRETGEFRPVRLPITAIIGVRKQGMLNQHQIMDPQTGVMKKFQVDVTDPVYGQDINLYYDQNADPANKYTVGLAGVRPLSPQELEQLNQMYDWAKIKEYTTPEEILQALTMNGYLGGTQVQVPGGAPMPEHGTEMALPPVPPPPPAYNQTLPPMGTFSQPAGVMPPPPPVQASFQQPVPAYQPPPPTNFTPPVAPPAPAYTPPVAPQAFAPTPPAVAPAFVAPAPTPVAVPTPAPTQAVPVVQPAPAPVEGERRFAVVGKPGGVSLGEFQQIVVDFSQKLPRGMPTKVWDREDLQGVQVPKCFASYAADKDCMSCPVRRYCLAY